MIVKPYGRVKAPTQLQRYSRSRSGGVFRRALATEALGDRLDNESVEDPK